MIGQVVKIYVQETAFTVVERFGIVKDIMKSKCRDLYLVEIEKEGVKPEYKIHYRFKNELK